MKKLLTLQQQLRFRLHWYHIRRYRTRAIALLDSGAPCCDPRLVELSNLILTHGMEVAQLWQQRKSSPQYQPPGPGPEEWEEQESCLH